MSRRGKLIFVCFLLGAVCALFQMRCGKPAQAAQAAPAKATLQGEAAIREWRMNNPEGPEQGFTPAAPNTGKRPCLNVAAMVEPARFCAGLRNTPGKQRLNAGQLDQVLLSLREQTGWQSLKFDEEGFLVCPEPQVFSGGSGAARRLLGAALFGDEAYYLEARDRSSAVAFARLAPGINYEHSRTGAKISSYPVQIDFADFQQLRGDGPALKAFDLGLVILHELAHGVWHLRDAASSEEEPGECETFINRIRRELRLPERQTYLARVRPVTPNSARPIAELRFTRTLEKQGRAKRDKQEKFWLRWDADIVGPITDLSLYKAGRRAETGKSVYAP